MIFTKRQPSTKAFGDELDDYEIQDDIRRGRGKRIQCRRFLATDVIPVQLTILYSLSSLIRKMSDLYPSIHFV